jgi:hypothetical protein
MIYDFCRIVILLFSYNRKVYRGESMSRTKTGGFLLFLSGLITFSSFLLRSSDRNSLLSSWLRTLQQVSLGWIAKRKEHQSLRLWLLHPSGKERINFMIDRIESSEPFFHFEIASSRAWDWLNELSFHSISICLLGATRCLDRWFFIIIVAGWNQ